MGDLFPEACLDFCVRQVRLGDEVKLSRFYERLSERSRYFFEPYSDTSVKAMQEVVRRSIEGKDLSCVGETREGEVFAHLFFRNVAEEIPHLGIGLLDAYQNCGLGTVFLQYLIVLGRYKLRKRVIGLTVMKENARAVHLYKKLGFVIVRDDVTFRSLHDSYEMHLVY